MYFLLEFYFILNTSETIKTSIYHFKELAMKDLLQKELYLWFLKSQPASTLKKQIRKIKKWTKTKNQEAINPFWINPRIALIEGIFYLLFLEKRRKDKSPLPSTEWLYFPYN